MKLSLCKTGNFQTGSWEFLKPEMRNFQKKTEIGNSKTPKNQVNTVTSTICDNQNDLFFSFVFFFFSFMRDAQ